MSGTRTRNVLVAVIGLLAVVGMLFPLSTLLAMVPTGEVAVLRVVPTVLGTLLLLIASLVLLFRKPEHGWTFAVATIALLVGMAWLHATLSPWHGFAVVAAAAGAVIGFRKERGDEAAE
ncbi:hypothetical protein SAMN04487785_106211 [Dyella jiangningensis]|uniref:hypothetical protein n=1 Tax=Dyella sp. AtDHG13 TaxID=1938897 RepID=UPI000886AEF6|nr:hypothetical protein [Dyella sp. AtDHG13]PXV52887.1 hypothetical protein BDW41_11753 [Dyella sp. AtDHG13]SDK28729.1 hypothetical protein SAMN04487785_106211 [Dyella jiangningensis]